LAKEQQYSTYVLDCEEEKTTDPPQVFYGSAFLL